MTELRNGASPTRLQIIIYYAHKCSLIGPWFLKYYLVPKAQCQKNLVFRALSTVRKTFNIILGT